MHITDEQGHPGFEDARPQAHVEDAEPRTPDGSICLDEPMESDVPVRQLIDYYEALKRLENAEAGNNLLGHQNTGDLCSAADAHRLLQEAHNRIAELEHRLLDAEVSSISRYILFVLSRLKAIN